MTEWIEDLEGASDVHGYVRLRVSGLTEEGDLAYSMLSATVSAYRRHPETVKMLAEDAFRKQFPDTAPLDHEADFVRWDRS